MNNELIAVESLIDRLSRGAKTEGAPVSCDDMLASKLEAISTPFEASAKARRLGKQSSFERLRRLGKQSSFGRRAASSQASSQAASHSSSFGRQAAAPKEKRPASQAGALT